jgi:hypothetical protein
MAIRFTAPKKSKPLWQTLLAPMLLASLGLHGLVLMLPAGSSDEVIPPPDPEQDSVAITRVPPPAVPANSPTQPVAGLSPAAPLPAQTQPRPSQPLAQSPQTAAPRSAAPRPAAPRPRSSPPSSTATPPNSAPNPSSSDSTPSPPAQPPAVVPSPDAAQPSRPLFNSELGEGLMAYAAALNVPLAQVDRLRASIQDRFGYAYAATTDEAYSTNQSQWEASIQQETGLADLGVERDRTDFSVTYPQRVCLRHEPGEIRLGVLTAADGRPQPTPVVLRSSGYGALDDRALQAVMEHTFPATGAMKAYTVTVNTQVDYGRHPCLGTQPES